MRAGDFFHDVEDHGAWANGDPFSSSPRTELDEGLLDALRRGPRDSTADATAALALLDLVHEELEAYGTGGGERLTDAQMALAIRAVEAVARRVGVRLQIPFRDFTRFRSYWGRNGASGSGGWQARRDILESLLDPARSKLQQLDDGLPHPGLAEESLAELRDPAVISEHLDRIQRAILDDPALAIGSAKDLIESTAKVALLETGATVDERADFPALVRSAQQALGLHPRSAAATPDETDSVRRILGAVSSIAVGVNDLRNRYGTGHGPAATRAGLRARHARLAVNSAVTWCQLVLDTLADESAPWRQSAGHSR